jgi:hypothetical protein
VPNFAKRKCDIIKGLFGRPKHVGVYIPTEASWIMTDTNFAKRKCDIIKGLFGPNMWEFIFQLKPAG